MRQLTENECGDLANALSVAAARFDEDAKISSEAPGMQPLVAQFQKQAAEARRWSEYFANIPPVAVGTCTYCANEEEHPERSICSDRPLLRLFEPGRW